MALPRSSEARLFYQAATQRFEDARFLLAGRRTTAAVYLAGYAVECVLKALILSSAPDKDHASIVASFRGAKAHDFGWLRATYLERGGPSFPGNVASSFARLNTWTTDMRYRPGTVKRRNAAAFLNAANDVLQWADGRL